MSLLWWIEAALTLWGLWVVTQVYSQEILGDVSATPSIWGILVLSTFSLQIRFKISVWSTGGSDTETGDWSSTVSGCLSQFGHWCDSAHRSLEELSLYLYHTYHGLTAFTRPVWKARVKTVLHELHVGIIWELPQYLGWIFLFTFLIIMYSSTFHTNLKENWLELSMKMKTGGFLQHKLQCYQHKEISHKHSNNNVIRISAILSCHIITVTSVCY